MNFVDSLSDPIEDVLKHVLTLKKTLNEEEGGLYDYIKLQLF
jgi:hypothetical protein